jgi:hypothetical protein
MPCASTTVSTLTCDTPTTRDASAADDGTGLGKRHGPKAFPPLAGVAQQQVDRLQVAAACSASALARLPSSRSVANMICWCSRQPSYAAEPAKAATSTTPAATIR